jgi:hypothetical protein
VDAAFDFVDAAFDFVDAAFDFVDAAFVAFLVAFFLAGIAEGFCLAFAGLPAVFLAADPFFRFFRVRFTSSGAATVFPRVPPPSFERIFSTAFLIGLLPFAEELPIAAPAIPPATAPTGPAIALPMTAPVTPPAVCFDTSGRFFSFSVFLGMIFSRDIREGRRAFLTIEWAARDPRV